MKTLYLDVFSGISGDMFLGAMIDLGLELSVLEHELLKLPVEGYHLHAHRQQNSGIEGIKFDVHLHDHHASEEAHKHEHGDEHGHRHDHGHSTAHRDPVDLGQGKEHHHEHSRNFSEITRLIQGSALSDWVKQKSLAVFRRVAVAEGKIHGQPPDQVHFHEVGAVDSIVDIVGAAIALECFGRPKVMAASVVDGTGWVDCAHGRFPVPTTATLEILGDRGVPITQCEEPHELVTPTGAALLAEFSESFGPMQNLVATKIGYGLGKRQNKTRPNVLRAVWGNAASAVSDLSELAAARDWETDTISVLETNLDDCSAEILGHLMERALTAGALDVFYTPIQMKKNRPGVLVSVLCATTEADRFTELLLRETTAFGVRRYLSERRKLERETAEISTSYGPVTVKLGRLNGQVVQASPEFESCRTLALGAQVSLKRVYAAAEHACQTLRAQAAGVFSKKHSAKD
jgi:uncharacterized protein (TIGR00299 family) protein